MKYKIILFDADGTLFDYDRAEGYALENSFRHFGVDYDPDYHMGNYREINGAIWEEFEQGLISSQELKAERFRRLFERLEMPLMPEEFSISYLDFLSKASFLLNGAVDVVSRLHGKYHLAIITNGLSAVQHPRLKSSPLAEYFEHIIVSEEVGFAKPHPGIFECAFEKIGQKEKSGALIIGDSLNSDIKGGIDFGIDTCWFNPGKKENTTDLKPTYEIHDLMELEEILEFG